MAMVAPGRSLTAVDAAALRTRSRADFVYDSLRDAISDGRIAAGERVREEEIAGNLGVSRTPVREALQRLQQRGLLVLGAGESSVRLSPPLTMSKDQADFALDVLEECME